MDTLLQALRNLGPVRLAIMGGVLLGLLAFFIFLTTRFTSSQMELLYGDLGPGDSQKIASQLASQSIPFEVRGDGTQIFVPGDDVLRARLDVANQGLPSGGTIGYEIFDRTDTLGTTNFVQNVNLVRALEGELARTIASINSVKSARVHLVLPKRQLFSREKQQASASIVIKMEGSGRLSAPQVQAIQHLAAAAVPGLTPNRISIVDNKGTLLAQGFEDMGDAGMMAAKNEGRRRSYENRLSRTIETLLEKTVGFGRVRSEVTADMDFDQISTTEEKFDPEGQVVRSTQTIDSSANTRDAEANQPVTVSTNLPDGALGGGESNTSTTAEKRTEETVNFEISKQVINHVRDIGVVKRLSVAVLVDGNRVKNEEGNYVYEPRGETEMELLATLVRSAIGFNADRGDTVDIINMQFAEFTEEEEKLELFFGLDKNDLLRIAEIMVLSIVAVLVILLVVRPLVSRAFEAIPAGMAAVGADGRLLAEPGAAPALTAPAGEAVPAAADQFDELIDIDRVEGRVKASSVKKVGEIVEKHPEEALSIIRSWMYQSE